MSYYDSYHPPPVVPAPPVQYAQYAPAPSAFSPHHMNYNDAPPSPLVVAASPAPSIGSRSRSSSHVRGPSHGEYVVGDGRNYLEAGGYGRQRSNSERGRVTVEDRSGRRTKRYIQPAYDDDGYSDEDDGSEYSYGSRRSRGHSRAPSHSRGKKSYHTRTPSWASGESFDERYALAVNSKPSKQEEELNAKLRIVEDQLKRVQMEGERKKLEDAQAEMERARNVEIERKVQEQLHLQKEAEAKAAWEAQQAAKAEKERIAAAAKQLLDEQAAAARAAAEAEEAKKQEVQAIIDQERARFARSLAAQPAKKTYTRFSKVHLCREALEERSIPFTEEPEYFLVHRTVDKPEQQYLWARTKEIRSTYPISIPYVSVLTPPHSLLPPNPRSCRARPHGPRPRRRLGKVRADRRPALPHGLARHYHQYTRRRSDTKDRSHQAEVERYLWQEMRRRGEM